MNKIEFSPWALHRHLYQWVLGFAHHRHSNWALFLLSFAESSFFPLAPDILQIALTLEKRANAWWYATINSIGSVLGGLFGYFIGAVLWVNTSEFFFKYIFSKETFDMVGALYQKWDFWIVFVAAFTPIPYKVITLAAGVFHISLYKFFLASLVGRSLRFFLVSTLLWYYGPKIKVFIEKYFNLLTLLFVALLIIGFILLEYI